MDYPYLPLVFFYALLLVAIAGALSNRTEQADKVRPIAKTLQWLYGLLTGPTFLVILIHVLTAGDWSLLFRPRPQVVFCGLLLGSGLLAGVRAGLVLTHFPRLLLVQAVLVGLTYPFVLDRINDETRRGTILYQDADVTVAIVEHKYDIDNFFRIDEKYATDVNLYQTILGFEHYVGSIRLVATVNLREFRG